MGNQDYLWQMKQSLLWIVCIASVFLACNSEQEEQNSRITLLRSPLMEELGYGEEKQSAADFMEDYFNIMYDSTVTFRNRFWNSGALYIMQDRFLKMNYSKESLLENPPKLLGIRKDDIGRFHLRICFESRSFPLEIQKLVLEKDAQGEFYFVDQLGEQLTLFKERKQEGFRFYYSAKCLPDEGEEEKCLKFNRKLADYFALPEKDLRVVVCADLADYARLIGNDYATYFNFNHQSGGRALPEENLFISANGSPYYPHELVHIYTSDFQPNSFFDEGIATWLGGSGGMELEEHLEKIAPHRHEWDFSTLPEDFYLLGNVQAKYLIGGMLMKLAQEQYGGKEAVFKLLNAGGKREEFYQVIEEVFGLEETEFDPFIKMELKKYEV